MSSAKTKNANNGFTVVELTIATTVFSIILLLSLVGFMQIGKLFYKGVNITHTSDVSKQVLNSVMGDVSFDVLTTGYAPTDGTFATDNITSSPSSPVVVRSYFCAGSNRYSFRLGQAVDSDASAAELKQPAAQVPGWKNFGILKDRVTNGCPKPFNSSEPINPANVTELLGDKMRLSDISIEPTLPGPNNKLYTIHIKVAYGDNEVLQSPTSDNPTCIQDSSSASSFCFVSDLRTIVRKGL
jgi:prepilin-type N-terminal cleavage/methylation domain-containing protein